jgi:hypothetical protein
MFQTTPPENGCAQTLFPVQTGKIQRVGQRIIFYHIDELSIRLYLGSQDKKLINVNKNN